MALLLALVAAPCGGQAKDAPGSAAQTGALSALAPGQWPLTAVGRLNVVLGASRRSHCTATLVGPRQVLTAAHCLFDPVTGAPVKPDQAHVVLGQWRDHAGEHRIAASYRADPGFAPGWPAKGGLASAHDWALVEFIDPVFAVRPVPLGAWTHADANGPDRSAPARAIVRVGYPQDRPFAPSLDGGCSILAQGDQGRALRLSCAAKPGESGGPLLLLGPGSSVGLIGVTSARLGEHGGSLCAPATVFAPQIEAALGR